MLWERLRARSVITQYYGQQYGRYRWDGKPGNNDAYPCSDGFPDRHHATWSITAKQVVTGKPADSVGPASISLADALDQALPNQFASSNCDSILPPCVTLHLGTNDVAIKPSVTPPVARQRVIDVADQIVGYFRLTHDVTPVILLAAPIKGKAGFFASNDIDELATLIKQMPSTNTVDRQQYIVDHNTDFDRGWLRDNVHPNNAGYEFMADQWYNAVVARCMPPGGGSGDPGGGIGARPPPPPRWIISPPPALVHFNPPPPPPSPPPPSPAQPTSCYDENTCSNHARCIYGHEDECANGGTRCYEMRHGNLLACMRCYGCADKSEASHLSKSWCFYIHNRPPSAPGGQLCNGLAGGLILNPLAKEYVEAPSVVSLGWSCPAYCTGEHCRLPACQNWVCQRDALRCQAYIGLVSAATAPSVPPTPPITLPLPPPPAAPPLLPSPPTLPSPFAPPANPPLPPFHPWPPRIPYLSPNPPKPWAPAPLPPQPTYPPNSPRPHPPPGAPPYPPIPPAAPHPPAAPPFPPHPPFSPPSPPSHPPSPPLPSYPYAKRRLEKREEDEAFTSCVAEELTIGKPRQNLYDFVLTSSSFLLESDFLDADSNYWCADILASAQFSNSVYKASLLDKINHPKDLCDTFYNRWYDKELGRERFQVCEWNVETGECGPREPCYPSA
jgi:lysophospholipase L1-like esterase